MTAKRFVWYSRNERVPENYVVEAYGFVKGNLVLSLMPRNCAFPRGTSPFPLNTTIKTKIQINGEVALFVYNTQKSQPFRCTDQRKRKLRLCELGYGGVYKVGERARNLVVPPSINTWFFLNFSSERLKIV